MTTLRRGTVRRRAVTERRRRPSREIAGASSRGDFCCGTSAPGGATRTAFRAGAAAATRTDVPAVPRPRGALGGFAARGGGGVAPGGRHDARLGRAARRRLHLGA